MNILIVDDEPRHLRGMAAMLRAMRPNARVSVAKDGDAALASVRAERPDVVLSDIQMPNMDGLAFLRVLEEEGIRTKVVMVSAYDLFEYAQTAIRHGACDYLLKPVDADKVEALLQRLEQQLAEELKERDASDELKQQLRQASSAYRSRLLHLWLSGDLPPDERAGLADWPVLREAEALVLTEIAAGNDGAVAPPVPIETLTERLNRMGAAFGQACAFPLQTAPNQGIRLVTALCPSQPLRQLRGEIREALTAVSKEWQPYGLLSHGIASLHIEAGECKGLDIDDGTAAAIPRLYRQAQAALDYAFHEEWQGVVAAEELVPPAAPDFPLDGERLFEALQEPSMATAEAMCRGAFLELAAGGRADPKLIKDYASLTLMKLKSRTRDIVDPRVGSAITETAVSAIPACRSREELMQLLIRCLSSVHKSLLERKQGRSELIVDQCLSWIRAHYREDLTLEMAAERFRFNASYFSTLMKARTGRSFSEHLTEARISRAKELLAAGRLKIYEIAEQCGYRDTKYFTRMFKRQVGLSPEAYKHTARPHGGNGDAP